jgi:hypothetical protein
MVVAQVVVVEGKVVTSVSSNEKTRAEDRLLSKRRDHMRRHAIAQRDQAAVKARGAH